MNLEDRVTYTEDINTRIIDTSTVYTSYGYASYVTVDYNGGTMFPCTEDYAVGDQVTISVSYINDDIYNIKLNGTPSAEHISLRDDGMLSQLQLLNEDV